jgi:hypothetical protein
LFDSKAMGGHPSIMPPLGSAPQKRDRQDVASDAVRTSSVDVRRRGIHTVITEWHGWGSDIVVLDAEKQLHRLQFKPDELRTLIVDTRDVENYQISLMAPAKAFLATLFALGVKRMILVPGDKYRVPLRMLGATLAAVSKMEFNVCQDLDQAYAVSDAAD